MDLGYVLEHCLRTMTPLALPARWFLFPESTKLRHFFLNSFWVSLFTEGILSLIPRLGQNTFHVWKISHFFEWTSIFEKIPVSCEKKHNSHASRLCITMVVVAWFIANQDLHPAVVFFDGGLLRLIGNGTSTLIETVEPLPVDGSFLFFFRFFGFFGACFFSPHGQHAIFYLCCFVMLCNSCFNPFLCGSGCRSGWFCW